MGKIFATSDLHLGHDRAFVWGARGFKSIEEHDAEIIKRWNEVVTAEDDVYILGDLMLGDNAHGIHCLSQLNGKLHILTGNHCTSARQKLYHTLENMVEFCGCATTIKYKKKQLYLSHYPTITSNMEANPHQAVFNLYGHTHQTTNFYNGQPFMYHVGVDSHNCYPVLLDDAITEINNEINACIATLGEKETKNEN